MNEENTEPTTEREFIRYRFNELKEQLTASHTNLSSRLDRMDQKMNSFAFAKQSDLAKLENKIDKHKDEINIRIQKLDDRIEDKYVKKESLKPFIVILTGLAVGVGVALIVGILKLMGAKVL